MMDLPTVPEPNVELSLQNFMSVSIAASAHADALATPYDDGVSFDFVSYTHLTLPTIYSV